MDIWGQDGADVRLEWGTEGVTELGRGCAALVIVDVLSFSTTVDLVLGRGARVLPVRWRDQRGAEAAKAAGATLAGERAWPSSVTKFPAGTLLAPPSPNVATLCAMAATTDILRTTDGPTALRPSVEDQLGAGAITAALAALGRRLSTEASLAAAGHAGDVALAAEQDVSRVAPVLTEGVLEHA